MALIVLDKAQLPTDQPPSPVLGDSYYDTQLGTWRYWASSTGLDFPADFPFEFTAGRWVDAN